MSEEWVDVKHDEKTGQVTKTLMTGNSPKITSVEQARLVSHPYCPPQGKLNCSSDRRARIRRRKIHDICTEIIRSCGNRFVVRKAHILRWWYQQPESFLPINKDRDDAVLSVFKTHPHPVTGLLPQDKIHEVICNGHASVFHEDEFGDMMTVFFNQDAERYVFYQNEIYLKTRRGHLKLAGHAL